MKTKLLIAFLFVAHCGLSFYHLNHTTMWDDEASVVWFAKNYNKYGDILGYDGDNIFSYRNGQLINNNLVYNNPPLDIYFTSYIIKYIGDTDFIVRMSFNIAGIIALVFYLSCMKIITGNNQIWYTCSAVLLLLSVNYLLIEGNSRYYSLNFLFGAVSLWSTLKLITNKGRPLTNRILFLLLQAIAIYLLFLSHYFAAFCWWAMCLFIMLRQGVIKISWKDRYTWFIVLVHLILFAFTTHYFITHNALHRPDMTNEDSTLIKYVKLLGWLFNDLNRSNIIPMWSVLVFIGLFIFAKEKMSSNFRRMAEFTLIFLLLSYLLNPQSTSRSTCFDVRYIYVIIPLLYLWIGYLLYLVYQVKSFGKVLVVAFITIYVNTTWLCYIPESTPPRFLLPSFVKERIEPYPTAYSESIKYINSNFSERKKILTIPGFHNTVFLRYVSDKINITNTLDEQSPLSRKIIDSLGMNCLYIGKCKPDYIFLFGNYGEINGYPYKVSDYAYIDTIPVFASGIDITRPELFWHSFGPRKVEDTDRDMLYILHN